MTAYALFHGWVQDEIDGIQINGKNYSTSQILTLEAANAALTERVKELEDFAKSFHITVVDNFYKDVSLHLDAPHSLSIRIPNDSSKSFIFKDLEDRRRAALEVAHDAA